MAEGITTRGQKEVGMLHKELELFRTEMVAANEQLRKDMETKFEAANLETRRMFSQLMLKFEASQGNGSESSANIISTEQKQKSILGVPGAVGSNTSSPTEFLNLTGTVRPLTKYSKLECPSFEGVNFRGWLLKIEQFFEADQTKEADKVRVVMMHLHGKALQWHQRFVKKHGALSEVSWNQYITEMRSRFSDNELSDPMLELVSLKHSGVVEEFYEEFESLLNLLQLPEDYALSVFISNLKPEISKSVRLFQPKTLTHALMLAKQLEAMMFNLPKKSYIPYKNPIQSSPQYPILQPPPRTDLPPLLPNPRGLFVSQTQTKYTPPNSTIKPYNRKPKFNPSKGGKMPTREERDDRRRKGLCMWCGAKYVLGHSCVKSQLYQLLVDDTEGDPQERDEFLDCLDQLEEVKEEGSESQKPVISLHAMLGTGDTNTMRLQGRIKNTQLVILVDSGSTHNFMDQTIAKKVGCHTHIMSGIGVSIANGDKIWVQEVCKEVLWETEGLRQVTDFMLLPLMGCDLVLGVKWLQELGPIVWDFKALTMQFTLQHQQFTLHGLKAGAVHVATKKQAARLCNTVRGTCTLLMTSVTPTANGIDSDAGHSLPLELQQLLSQFGKVFEVPIGLPPRRKHDHKIPLLDESQTVKLRPYRYLSIQKDEIERMVAEMKSTGVIRDSTSSFASPIVLVKKKDGS